MLVQTLPEKKPRKPVAFETIFLTSRNGLGTTDDGGGVEGAVAAGTASAPRSCSSAEFWCTSSTLTSVSPASSFSFFEEERFSMLLNWSGRQPSFFVKNSRLG